MRIRDFVSSARSKIHEDLLAGREPSIGSFDRAALSDAKAKGSLQFGTVVYRPGSIRCEFIFSSDGNSHIVGVDVKAPERIVYLPVPGWVVENVWQGDVTGSFAFESEAVEAVRRLEEDLKPEANAKLFDKQPPKRRE